MKETPTFILAQLNDAAKRMATDGSTTYFEQVANRASSISRNTGRGRRILLTPFEPNGDTICIDTSAMTVAYTTSRTPLNNRFSHSAHIPPKTTEAINHYFDYIEKVASKLK